MTRTGAAARPLQQEGDSSFMEWMQENGRVLTAVVIVLVALVLGAYLYLGTQLARAEKAEQALGRAEQSLSSGNVPLAQTDLQRVVTAYNGTSAATTAAMLLAQTKYDQGKYQEGIDQLQRTAQSGATKPLAASVEALIGDGYMGLNKPADAAKHYEEAAAKARFDADKAQYRASAARAYLAAGNPEAARTIWEELANDPTGATAGEARVRLGELQAKPAGRS
jgi:predicted negative regulator of RcsB-dependent stress response